MPTRFRALAVVLLAGVGLLTLSPAAFAHVTVIADNPEPGHVTKAVFRVPNERDDAATVQVRITFPDDHPLGSVSVAPVPGWTPTVEKRKLTTPIQTHGGQITETVTAITWQGGQIRPGEFVEFPVSLSLPHDAVRLEFKALQSYSDGQVVRWIESQVEGAPEPEHPAPVLSLAMSHPPQTTTASGADALARTIGAAGLITAFGALAATLALVGRRRVTRPPAGAASRVNREKARV